MPETVNNKFVLSHIGEINYDNIGLMLAKLRKKMDQHGFKLGTYKKVLAVLVECLENIYKYLDSVTIDKSVIDKRLPYFKLEFIDDYFLLEAGNPVRKKDASKLENKLNEINGLDESGLKKLYKRIITDGKFTEKGGAGLGFIEMIKTTGEKINFSFEKINSDILYFNINIKIPIK